MLFFYIIRLILLIFCLEILHLYLWVRLMCLVLPVLSFCVSIIPSSFKELRNNPTFSLLWWDWNHVFLECLVGCSFFFFYFLKSFFSLSFWIASIITSSISLISFFRMSNLPLILSSVLFKNIYLFSLCRVLVAAHEVFIVACGFLAAACMWDLVPQPRIKPRHPALGAWSFTHWTTREVPVHSFKTICVWYFLYKTFLLLWKEFNMLLSAF